MIPVASIVVIVAHYVLAGQHVGPLWCLVSGILVAVAMFFGLYWIYKYFRFNTAPHASVVAYNDLCERMHRIATISEPTFADETLQETAGAAFAEVRTSGDVFEYARQKRGLHWVLGKGYVDLARSVHRAEEAAILYEPVNLVVADAFKDQLRVEGSTMPHADELLNRIRRALITVSAGTERYLAQLPPRVEVPDPPPEHSDLSPEAQARVVLSAVRYSINDFRDTARTRLIDARNELLARMFLTGLATAVLLIFIVLGRPPEATLLTGAVLYAIGATIGLFSRLYADLSSEGVGEDFAISYVRLFQTFLLSGHAAIAGIYIVVALPFALNNPVLPPEPTPIVTAGAPATPAPIVVATPATGAAYPAIGAADRPITAIPRVENVYNVDRYPFSIVLAMVFGLTPGLLISKLSQTIETSKRALRSSELSTKGTG